MKKHLPWLLVLTILAILVRIQGTFQYGLNWDELNTLVIAKLPLTELFRIIYIRDFHPPGMHLLLHFWILCFGDGDAPVRAMALCAGVAGIWMSYCLALEITQQKRVAFLTALFCVFSPLLIRYSSVTLQYVVAYGLILLSWYSLLVLLRQERLQKPWLILYFVSTALAINTYATAVIYFVFQAGFYLRYGKQNKPLFWTAILALVTLLPFVWVVLQPWHVSHTTDAVLLHSKFLTSDLWTLVPQYLFLRNPQLNDGLWLETIASGMLLGLASWSVFGRRLQVSTYQKEVLLWLGVLPFGFLMLLSFMADKPFFLARTLLYCLFVFYLVLAWWLAQSRVRMVVGSLLILGLQVYIPWQMPFRDISLKAFGSNLKQVMTPQDGLLIYPGSQHLAVMRYANPKAFGLTARELNFDPTRENAYHMAQLIDAHHFWVSGDDVMQQSSAQLKQFLASNARVFVYGRPERLTPYLNCQQNVLIMNEHNQWVHFPCQR